jgi:cyclase
MGSQGVVACIDYKTQLGKKRVFVAGGTRKSQFSPGEIAQKVVSFGAGEIILQDMNREGSLLGFDLETLDEIKKLVDVPIAILGGAGTLEHINLAFDHGASAACAGTMFVTQGPHKAVLINYFDPASLDKLRGF